MAKYTTLVRSVCETYAGLTESVGFDNIDQVINGAWDKVFTQDFPIYDEDYRKPLCCKILKHFYMREIGMETVGLWKHYLNERMGLIMPYYNQLYQSALIKFDPMRDVDVTTTSKRDVSQDENTESEKSSNYTRTDNLSQDVSGTTSSTGSNDRTYSHKDLYSDTPQGALTGVENETYLTNARKVSDTEGTDTSDSGSYSETKDNTGTQKNVGTDNTTGSRDYSSTDQYLENVVGKRGGTDYSDLLMKFRETFLNIDQMIINELDDLFMCLW